MLKKRRIRRRWEDGEKIRIVAQTRVPGVSVSQVARRYDVNANLVFKWLRDPRFNPPPEESLNGSFLPVEVVASAAVIDPPVIDAPIVETPVIGNQTVNTTTAANSDGGLNINVKPSRPEPPPVENSQPPREPE